MRSLSADNGISRRTALTRLAHQPWGSLNCSKGLLTRKRACESNSPNPRVKARRAKNAKSNRVRYFLYHKFSRLSQYFRPARFPIKS